jgi:hypothetical protein
LDVLDDMTRADKIGRVLSLLRIIKRPDETHRALFSSVRAHIAGIESNTSVSSILTQQAEEVPLPATDFNNRFIVEAVFRLERLSQLLEVVVEVGRAALGVFVGSGVAETVRVECCIEDKTAR